MIKRLLLAICFLLLAVTAQGATYYVCSGGDGSAPTDGTCANAYDEVEDAASAQALSGDTVQFLSDVVEPDICAVGDDDDTAIIDLNGYKWSTNGSYSLIAAGAGLTGLTVKNGTMKLVGGGTTDNLVRVYADEMDDFVFEDLVFDLSAGNFAEAVSFYMADSSHEVENPTFKNCVFIDSGGQDVGIELKGEVIGVNVINCVFSGLGVGILLDDDAEGDEPTTVLVYNSVFTGFRGIEFSAGTVASNLTATNCIFVSNTHGVYDGGDGADPTFATNAWFNNSSADCYNCTGDGTVTTDPMVVGVGGVTALDYKIKNASPCKNVGTTLAAVPTDFWGTARPVDAVYDIGIHEAQKVKRRSWWRRIFRRR